jgi:predicted nucleic acid-binding protein
VEGALCSSVIFRYEDMQHGMTPDEGLRIVDPFRRTPR